MRHAKAKDHSGRYTLVNPEEYELDDEDPLHSPLSTAYSTSPRSWWDTAKIVLWVEFANLAVLAIIFAAFYYRPFASDKLYMPSALNVSKTFRVGRAELELVANNTAANEYWMSITRGRNNGLVSLPKEWAERQGLRQSGLATREGETVFQVDAFHQLHCLVYRR
jgi:hypothetical protein